MQLGTCIKQAYSRASAVLPIRSKLETKAHMILVWKLR